MNYPWLRQFTSGLLLLKKGNSSRFPPYCDIPLPGLMRRSFGEAGFRLARGGKYRIAFVLLEFRPNVFIT